MPIMFSQSFLNEETKAAERKRWHKTIAKNDPHSITLAVRGVIKHAGVYDDLSRISLPTLILVGGECVATTPEK